MSPKMRKRYLPILYHKQFPEKTKIHLEVLIIMAAVWKNAIP